MTRALILLLVCCGRADAPAPVDEHPAVVLADQPIIKDGVRDWFLVDLAAYPASEHAAALERAVRTIRLRFQAAGIIGHVSVATRPGEVMVDLADDPDMIRFGRDLVLRAGRLELRFAEPGSTVMAALAEHVAADPEAARRQITSKRENWMIDDGKRFADWSLRAVDREEVVIGGDVRDVHCRPAHGGQTVCRVTGRETMAAYVTELAKRDPRFAIPADRMLVYERLTPVDAQPFWTTYLVERTALATGDAIKRATVTRQPQSERPAVVLELDRTTTKTLATASSRRIGDKLAIVIDDEVVNAPFIGGPIRDGRLQIWIRDDPSRRDEETQARDLAIVLGSGPLPGKLRYQLAAELVGGVEKFEHY